MNYLLQLKRIFISVISVGVFHHLTSFILSQHSVFKLFFASFNLCFCFLLVLNCSPLLYLFCFWCFLNSSAYGEIFHL